MLRTLATASAVAFVVYSCSGKLKEAEHLNLETTPIQVVHDMFAVQSKNGKVEMRMEAPLMEKYEKDTSSLELFPNGFSVFSYNEENLMETVIVSDRAEHWTYKNSGNEEWIVIGNVVIQNVIEQQTMETDTLYWDRKTEEIYTDCYVRMYSVDGFMQGYGMRADQRGNDAIILKPFNSYTVVVQDTTMVIIDSVNFIGPFPKK